jgi:hypothetical protein
MFDEMCEYFRLHLKNVKCHYESKEHFVIIPNYMDTTSIYVTSDQTPNDIINENMEFIDSVNSGIWKHSSEAREYVTFLEDMNAVAKIFDRVRKIKMLT